MHLSYDAWHDCYFGSNSSSTGANVGYTLPKWYCGNTVFGWQPFLQSLDVAVIGAVGLIVSLALFFFFFFRERESPITTEQEKFLNAS